MMGVVGAAWATLISYAVAGMLIDVTQLKTRGMFAMKLDSFNLIASCHRLIRLHK